MITDFRAGDDVIEIASGAGRFSQLNIHKAGDGSVIEFANVKITLDHVRPAQLDADDFLFT